MSSISRIVTCAAAALLFLGTLSTSSSADSFQKIELSFSLPNITGNPFDYTRNDVRVAIMTPDGKKDSGPAFFDGGTTWRVRYTPRTPGRYVITACERNGEENAGALTLPREINITGKPNSGFIRVSAADKYRFAFDNGDAYFPLGNDVAWRAGPKADVTDFFDLMGAAGENWSRVWMCHWDGKNLDWPRPKGGEGYLDLTVARHWDAIIDAAEKNGIYFQLTLQHHGQYSTMVDPNWNDNPWSKKNGGFLDNPEQFFTDEHARTLTKAKYRYILARYGYSPNIMSWELFNEVEGTDAGRKQQYALIAAWHKEMAAFLRSQDLSHHLITTSSEFRITGLFDAMDYFQPHSYSPDPMAAIAGIDPKAYGKPVFFGEMGPSSGGQSDPDFVRTILWSSMMSSNSGAGQYWFWDQMTAKNLFPLYASASGFLRESGIERQPDMKSVRPEVKTNEQGSFAFGPGGGWGTAPKTQFSIDKTGAVEGVGSMPSYFQGKAHHEMFPSLEFDVNYAANGDFGVSVGNVAKAGAALSVLVDGKPAASHDFAAADRDTFANITLHAAVPAGEHKITLENGGADWVSLNRFTLKPYGPALHALARVGRDLVVTWVYRTEPVVASRFHPTWLVLTGLSPGEYNIEFWNTEKGGSKGSGMTNVGEDGRIQIGIPIDGESIAMYMKRK